MRINGLVKDCYTKGPLARGKEEKEVVLKEMPGSSFADQKVLKRVNMKEKELQF